jgi:hypothetical protein
MCCAPGLIFGGTEGVGSRFHVLRALTRFRRYLGRRVPFTCFALTDSFSAVARVSCPFFMFCAPGLVFGNIEGVKSRFHVLRARNCFRRYRGHQVLFSCFALQESSAVPSASGPVFMFCASEIVIDGYEGVGSHIHVLRARTHFRQYLGRRDPFSYFALQDSFSAVPRASGPIFIFCAHGLIFGGTEGVGSHFHVLRARTHFRWYRGRRIPFSYFALPKSFSAVPSASGPVFMFCAPGHVIDGAECVGSRFHVLRSRTRYRRCRGRRVPFSCFALSDSFSVVPRVSGSALIFCSLGHVFGGIKGVGSRFHVLFSETHLRRYRGCLVPFSCIARLDSFSTVSRASGPVFMFFAP